VQRFMVMVCRLYTTLNVGFFLIHVSLFTALLNYLICTATDKAVIAGG